MCDGWTENSALTRSSGPANDPAKGVSACASLALYMPHMLIVRPKGPLVNIIGNWTAHSCNLKCHVDNLKLRSDHFLSCVAQPIARRAALPCLLDLRPFHRQVFGAFRILAQHTAHAPRFLGSLDFAPPPLPWTRLQGIKGE